MGKLLIIGDADGLIASINPADANNQHTHTIRSFLNEQKAVLSFPVTAIAEGITALQRKHSNPYLAKLIVDQCLEGSIFFTPVDETVIAIAITFYNPHGSKQNTFFDAIVAAIAKLHNADAIFSFDEWYTKQGFILAGNLAAVKS